MILAVDGGFEKAMGAMLRIVPAPVVAAGLARGFAQLHGPAPETVERALRNLFMVQLQPILSEAALRDPYSMRCLAVLIIEAYFLERGDFARMANRLLAGGAVKYDWEDMNAAANRIAEILKQTHEKDSAA